MLNATLDKTLALVKAEVGICLAAGVGTADDLTFYTLIDAQQEWLVGEFDWPFLEITADMLMVPGTRYYTMPTSIDLTRPLHAHILWNEKFFPVDFGIGEDEYNTYSSGDNGVAVNLDPIQRWDFHNASTGFEVWPIPASTCTLRFRGQRVATDLGGPAYATHASVTLDLDHQLVALFTAAGYLTRVENPKAPLIMKRAMDRLAFLRSSNPTRDPTFQLGAGANRDNQPDYRAVPIVAVAGS